ncbi:IS1 family transposase [Almyronema epifaneia S1]|uniref:IS1 family transposase n=1 Tax=Almyronema epifaneia S1 TaxID=2991925 RepID=A0ABW6ICP4_9CYAN
MKVSPQKKGRLTIQCDELWSLMGNKGNKQWVWLALDANTRGIVGVYIDARDEAAARKLTIVAAALSPMCDCLYRLLSSVCSNSTQQAASNSG